MPTIRLFHYEAKEDQLPAICMVCGAAATTRKSKQFSWCPPWVLVLIIAGLLPFLIVTLILTKRMRVTMPFCDQHKNYWSRRMLITWLGLALCIIVGIVLAIVIDAADLSPERSTLGGILCAGIPLLALAWLIAAQLVQRTAIRPKEITDRDIVLMGVARQFVDALHMERHGEDEPRSARLQGRKVEDIYDPEALNPEAAPRKPRPDSFRE